MVPGAHNARNAAGALAALAAAGANTADAAAALAEFTGVGRRFELRGAVAGATIVDDYAHNPAKLAAVIDAARTYAPARVVVCFQPHLYSRTAASAHAFGGALAGADEVVVTEIYAARERPVAGVTAKLVVDAVSERRPGMPLAYMPDLDDAAGYLRARMRAGDLVLTVGAGDVRRRGRRAAAMSARAGLRRGGLPRLAADDGRHRRPGALPGPARGRAPSSPTCCGGRQAEGLEIAVVGLGSNLLVADEGYDGLVLRLAGELARIERDGDLDRLRRRRVARRDRQAGDRAGASRASSSAVPSPAPPAARCA